MEKITREEAIDALCHRDMEQYYKDSEMYELFKFGIEGWSNRTDRELIEFYIYYILDARLEDIEDFIYVTDAGEELTVEPLGAEDRGGVGIRINGVESDYECI
jgi:hypothetical protein